MSKDRPLERLQKKIMGGSTEEVFQKGHVSGRKPAPTVPPPPAIRERSDRLTSAPAQNSPAERR